MKTLIATLAVLVIVATFIAVILAPVLGFVPILGGGLTFASAWAVSIILIGSFIVGFLYFRVVGGIVAILSMFFILWVLGMI